VGSPKGEGLSARRYYQQRSIFSIHFLAASMASGMLLSMTALRAAAEGGHEAIIDKSIPASPIMSAVE
jgi:hypothetical protein